jgi:hypothetical protein
MPSKAIGSAVVVHGKVCTELCQKGLSTAGTQTLKHAPPPPGRLWSRRMNGLDRCMASSGSSFLATGTSNGFMTGQVAAVPGLHDGTQLKPFDRLQRLCHGQPPAMRPSPRPSPPPGWRGLSPLRQTPVPESPPLRVSPPRSHPEPGSAQKKTTIEGRQKESGRREPEGVRKGSFFSLSPSH